MAGTQPLEPLIVDAEIVVAQVGYILDTRCVVLAKVRIEEPIQEFSLLVVQVTAVGQQVAAVDDDVDTPLAGDLQNLAVLGMVPMGPDETRSTGRRQLGDRDRLRPTILPLGPSG